MHGKSWLNFSLSALPLSASACRVSSHDAPPIQHVAGSEALSLPYRPLTSLRGRAHVDGIGYCRRPGKVLGQGIQDRGFFEPGRVNAHDKSFSGGDTHPAQVAEAIRNNPSYDGGPVRLISCHSGTNGAGVDSVSAAQQVANKLGVPVMAPTNKVGVMPDLGTQQPTIYLDGYWRTFLPVAN